MKLWIMIFSAAVFAGGTCLGVALHPRLAPKPPAATPPSTEPWGGWRSELSFHRFASELGLSDEQDQQLERIVSETQRHMESFGFGMRTAQDQSRDRVKAILTAEQNRKLDELVAQERRKRSEAEVRKSVEAYTKILALSEEQARGLQEALLEGKAKRREAYASDKHRGDRTQLRSIREEQNRRIEKAISPDQFRKYMEIQDLFEDRRGS